MTYKFYSNKKINLTILMAYHLESRKIAHLQYIETKLTIFRKGIRKKTVITTEIILVEINV